MGNKQKAAVGFSGGVDSTAAAMILKSKGYEVTGVFLDVLGDGSGAEEAREAARQIGIELACVDVSGEFSKTVISNFCSEYMKGRTPNPCTICNPRIKFKHLLAVADEIGAGCVATGHYAKAAYDSEEGCFFVYRAKSAAKDQSYMLYRLGSQFLHRLTFPLGDFASKEEVRGFLGSEGIGTAKKKDSQEICFLPPGTHYADYLASCGFSSEEGDFVDIGGNVIGRHRGALRYTVGQRKNLGMTFGKPMFVVSIDSGRNRVTLGGNEELFSKEVFSQLNFFTRSGSGKMPEGLNGYAVEAKIRYSAKPAEAVVTEFDEDTVKTVFKEPQRAAAPGQSIVFYSGGKVVGGGVIRT
ncbi:MAG: tRNA 2-thiouridine(34) synthase MnmA [Clostridiales bacterium]|nr:tRNA 2-thiouridine(34) synthase MnmA [Clostridiales bacterium]